MDTKTICLLNDSFPPMIDGVANAVVNYARRITDAGYRALVVTPSVPGADDSAFPFPVLRYPSLDTRRQLGYVTGYPFSPEVAAALEQTRPALLHTHCPIASCLMARSLREVVDAPLVLTYHTKFDVDIAHALRGKLLQESAIHALIQNVQACDEVWVVSRGAGENLRSLGYTGDYLVMPNGVDVPRGRVDQAAVDAVTAPWDLPNDVPMFLFVGRLMWYKGLRLILDALARLRAQGTDFRMVFVGSGGDGEQVQDYTRSLKLDDRCLFTGAVSDREVLRAWYSRADLFLFPSTFDTNGLVVREAAACGCASVMVAGSCAAEGVEDGRTGFLIEESSASLADCLTRLCAAPAVMRQVGESAQQELYVSWADAVNRAMERYEIVIDRYRSGAYPRHKGPVEGFLRAQGELMEALAAVEAERRHLHQELQTELKAVRERLHADRD